MMKILTKIAPLMAKGNSLDNAVAPVITAIQWVMQTLAAVGVILITISLIKVGIKMANADSPEAAQKCKKQIIYCIVGLVLCVGASIAIPFIGSAVTEWATANFETSLVMIR